MNAAQIILEGTIVDGALLALTAVGFVVVYRATRVISFCQGLFMVIGAVYFADAVGWGAGLYGSLLISMAITGVIGAAVYRLLLVRVVGAEPFITAIATIGLATAGEALVILLAGDQPIVPIHSLFSKRYFHIAGTDISPEQVFTIIMTVVVFVVLITAIHRTKTGLRMRAVADHPRLAAFNGINVGRLSTGAWGIAAIAGALAGAAFVLTTQPSPDTVYGIGLDAFPAILLGGFDSIPGAIVGGLLIGLVQNTTIYYLGGQWQDVVSYIVLLAVLVLRPSGLFGNKEVVRL